MTASTSPAPKTARYESGDWLFFVLLRAMALCLPLVIAEVGWIPNAPALVPVSLLATVVGVLFALSPLPNWLIGCRQRAEPPPDAAKFLKRKLSIDYGRCVYGRWLLSLTRMLRLMVYAPPALVPWRLKSTPWACGLRG